MSSHLAYRMVLCPYNWPMSLQLAYRMVLGGWVEGVGTAEAMRTVPEGWRRENARSRCHRLCATDKTCVFF